MSKVGNLRAMFENKGDTSPPERGRSPGLSSAGAESPRPLSKIRTNFVAIEKDGRLGLQRDPSSDSVLSSSRKLDGEGEAASSAPQENPPSFADRIKNSRQGLQMETIPQSPPQDMPSTFQSITPARHAATPSPDKARDSEDKAPGKTPAVESKDTKDTPRSATPKPAAKQAEKDQSEGVNGKTVERDKAKPASKDVSKATGSGKLTATARPAAINTSKTTTRAPAKSPSNLKTPTSPLKSTRLPTKTPEKKTLQADKTATPKATPKAKTTGGATSKSSAAAAPADVSASATKKAPVLQASPARSIDRGVGFTKPKVKSPTRPVPLPAGLTTHTTASATRQSLSRQSGILLSAQPAQGRSPSRTSVSTTGGSSSGKTLRRQSSTVSRPRPSLGPPPKQPAADHPITRREREVDEGFLARMMRPTQASSSKTHEKVVSPPRKAPGALPATKRAVGKDATAEVKKAPTKPDFAAPKKSIPRPTPTKSASKPSDKKTAAAVPAPANKAASQPEPKKDEVETPKPEPAEEKVAPEPAEEKTTEQAAPEPAAESTEEPVEDVSSEQEPVDQAKAESEPEAEQPVESADATPAPVASPTADASLEETASEAEPVEPKTPAETTETPQDNGATALVTDGAETKVVEEDKTVVEVEEQADDIPVAE